MLDLLTRKLNGPHILLFWVVTLLPSAHSLTMEESIAGMKPYTGPSEKVRGGPYIGPRDVLIERAMAALRKADPKAQVSPQRPVYRLRPIANWMNDINGAYFQDGTYHIMYQRNPYADTWGNMHWGLSGDN